VFSSPLLSQTAQFFSFHYSSFLAKGFLFEASNHMILCLVSIEPYHPPSSASSLSNSPSTYLRSTSSLTFLWTGHWMDACLTFFKLFANCSATETLEPKLNGDHVSFTNYTQLSSFNLEWLNLKGLPCFRFTPFNSSRTWWWSKSPPIPIHFQIRGSVPTMFSATRNLSRHLATIMFQVHLFFKV